MLMTKERPRAIRTLRGWAIHVLQEARAIYECEEHGWAKDRADPHAREHALAIARQPPRPACLRIRRWPRSAKCWIRSATPARNARPNTEPASGCNLSRRNTWLPKLRCDPPRLLLLAAPIPLVDEFYRRALGKPFRDALGVPVRETDTPVRFRLGHLSRKRRAVDPVAICREIDPH